MSEPGADLWSRTPVLELYRLSGKRQSTLVQAMQVIKRDHADPVGREAQKLLLDALYLVRRGTP